MSSLKDRAKQWAEAQNSPNENDEPSYSGCLGPVGCSSLVIAVPLFVWGEFFSRPIGPIPADIVVIGSCGLIALGVMYFIGAWIIQTFFTAADKLTLPTKPGQTRSEAFLDRVDRAMEVREKFKARAERLQHLDDPPASRSADLKNRRDEGEIELELERQRVEKARLKRERDDLRNSAGARQQPSAEERRAKERSAIELDLERLKNEKQRALKLEDETERILRVNAIDDAIARTMERWGKLL